MFRILFHRSIHMIKNFGYLPQLWTNLSEHVRTDRRRRKGVTHPIAAPVLTLMFFLLYMFPSMFVSFCCLQEGGDYGGP